MAYFIDRAGQLFEADPTSPEELTALTAQGFAPATDADLDRHDKAEAVKAADEGGFSAQAMLEGGQRIVGRAAGAIGDTLGISAPVPAGLEGEGTSSAEQAFPEAFDEDAQLRAEAHPFSAGLGAGIATAPAALPFGALAGAAATGLGASALVGTGAAVLGEAGVEAVAQEYDNAWLEDRPPELKNVATFTGMFALGDVVLRGLGRVGKRVVMGERNIVSEANGVLRKKAGTLGDRPGSVGSARATDLDDPFEPAIKKMSDRDAVILDRDSDDYYKVLGTDVADGFTRIYKGLDEDLGNAVKYEDFEKGAAQWSGETHQVQANWINDIVEKGEEIAAELRRGPKGDVDAIDYGNAGKMALKTIDDYSRQLAQSSSGARRNYLADNYKRQLQKHVMRLDASFATVDNPTRDALKGQLEPLQKELLTGLQDPVLFGRNAHLQRELNVGWHQFLKSWSKVETTFFEKTGEVLYNHSGPGRIVKEGTTRKAFDVLKDDPRLNRELQRHLSVAFEGLGDMIGARQRWGLSRMGNLDNLVNDLGALKEDWNLAATVGVAKNKALHARKDPRKWASLIADVAERLPGGGMVGAARTAGRVMQGTRLTAGTPLADVWSKGLARFAKHPDLADPAISQNYSPWMQQALRDHGGKVAAGGLFAGAMLGAPGTAGAAERPPPEQLGPEVAYRQAMQENARGGRLELLQAVGELVGTRRPNRSDSKLKDDLPLTAEAVLELAASLDELAADPAKLIERVSSSTGELARTHPGVFGAMVQQAARIVGYLAAKRPQPVGRSASQPNGLDPSHDELFEWSGRVFGATRPRQTIKAIGRGTAQPEAVEALQASWPDLWAELRTGVAGMVSRMAEDGADLDPERISYLDRELGFDGALDAMQSDAMTGHILGAIDAHASRQQAQPPGKASGGGAQSTRLQTRLGSISAERQMQ